MNPDQPQGVNNPTQPTNVPSPSSGPTLYPPLGIDTAAPKQPTPPKNKNIFIIVGAVLGVLLLLVIAAVVLSSSKKATPSKAANQNTTNASSAQLLEPANPLNIEYINDSIGQDIGTLNDEQDLPPTKLDDKAVGL